VPLAARPRKGRPWFGATQRYPFEVSVTPSVSNTSVLTLVVGSTQRTMNCFGTAMRESALGLPRRGRAFPELVPQIIVL